MDNLHDFNYFKLSHIFDDSDDKIPAIKVDLWLFFCKIRQKFLSEIMFRYKFYNVGNITFKSTLVTIIPCDYFLIKE